ncbi:DNA-binding transcriptional regulator, MerR family [Bosea lupini]|uniref:DNA-binding transcriptional regulator, MerR family n=1 Tax=Bosea lupini TaxID=1036779 RepID=A0A1H7IBF6_9HYPH|nr:helix-turn-helix domain-containing protein [Bosea lupini]SEK59077.1 DNA-binding transcriptional regulator, MerR family [Bosea lupini]
MTVLDIGEVAERAGVAPSTLRYYEEIGLIASLRRRGLRRQFDADVLLKLSLIAMGKAAGFSLEEIAGMFGRDGRPDIPRDQLRLKADELQRQMAELRTLRDMLRHIADCPAPSHLECPTFRKLMQAASRRKLVYRPSVRRSGARRAAP